MFDLIGERINTSRKLVRESVAEHNADDMMEAKMIDLERFIDLQRRLLCLATEKPHISLNHLLIF